MLAGQLKNKVLFSPLASHSAIKPNNRRGKKGMNSALMLTSLVDAFSILVIFLMMNSANEQSDFQADKNIKLPSASQAEASLKTTEVKVVNGQFLINDEVVKENQLVVALEQIQKKLESEKSPAAKSLLIIGDKEMDYGTLNPIIVMGSRAGFSEFKFAVIKETRG